MWQLAGREQICLPAPLPEVAGWQERVQRHATEHLADLAPLVQILDALVPQMGGDVTDTLRILDFPIAEQVIEVPKISCSPCPSRSLVLEPQLADQLVEVPTVLSPTRIALLIAEQIVDTPVPRGRGQGFLPGQSSSATPSAERISERIVEHFVDIRSGGPQGFRPGQGSPASSSFVSPAGSDDDANEPVEGVFFALFPDVRKARSWLRTRV